MFLRSSLTPRWTVILLALAGLAMALLRPTPSHSAAPMPLERLDETCGSDNPFFVSPAYAMGDRKDEPALLAYRDGPERFVLATYDQIGATYGTAFDPRRRLIYAAAFHKRGTPFGPGGPGMIYRLDLSTGQVEPWLDVPDAGANNHDPRENYIPDRLARSWPGLTSLGDIDLSEDGTEIFVTNLFTRRILRYRVADGQLLSAFDFGAAKLAWGSAEGRPFALKPWRGKLYHGVVRDASKSKNARDLEALVYETGPDGTKPRVVLSFKLDYYRGLIPPNIRANWLPWQPNTDTVAPRGTHDHAYIYPMPMLSDIEFADNGDMVLGLRDRIGDMSLYDRNRNLPAGERSGHPFGDILLARPAGDRWQIDGPWPEFFNEDAGGGMNVTDGFHIDTGFGGLARVWGHDQVLSTAVSPLEYHAGGAIWFSLADGGDRRRTTLYVGNAGRSNFAKSNGLGDAEVLCGEGVPTATPTETASPSATTTATPTAPATATVTPTFTPSATWTPSATPTPYRIYLPFTEKTKPCDPDAFRTSVVLVLDRSTSMLRPIQAGGIPKNEAAIEAAKAFLANLQLEADARGRRDQVAVVGFNDNAWIEQELTSDRGAALAALDRIRSKTQEGTRLDLAFQWGQKPLDGPERIASNRPVVIVLTDGLPNRVPFGEGSPYPGARRQEDSVLLMANAVKAAGSRVYTVALGTPRDILPWLMIDAASERWMYHFAPRPEDLAGIYAQIAATFNECRPKPTPRPCDPQEMHADIVLVLDMSTSMYRPTRGGRSKMEAAIAAAHSFVTLLDLERDGWGRQDQLGVVGFNGKAWTAIGLTDDAAAIQAAIDGLPDKAAEGTRLDLALRQGQKVLGDGPRLQPNAPVLVLMTDGLPNQVPFGAGSLDPDCPTQECVVLRAAAAVKDAGTRLLAIGLGEGEDVLRGLLEGVATTPGDYFFAPDGEDLAAIYRLVAGRLQECPKALAGLTTGTVTGRVGR
ncbi:MAG: VWA domain-containing protein [Ardenticatenia bacterium]|nr:VWA domain-containing protein [Ardenticatenia bacterium]